MAHSKIVDTTELVKSEDDQDQEKIALIGASMVGFADDGDWDEVPAIIVNTDGIIIDGHHRVAASILCGLNEWRALVVEQGYFDALEDASSWFAACRVVCDENSDDVTWGSL